MKNKFKNNKKLIVVQSSLMAGVMFVTGCANSKSSNQTSTEISFDSSLINETDISTETTIESMSTPTPTPVAYSFSWSNEDSDDFAEYFESVVGKNLRAYVISFGFTDELNDLLTKYVNNKYNAEYESIPFSKVSYFHTYIVNKEVDRERYRKDSETFYKVLFDSEIAHHGAFVNKLVMSYFYQNEIPLGSRISYENLKNLGIDDMYSFSGVDFIVENGNLNLGNYDSSYSYSNYELFAILQAYNSQLYRICNDERIKNLDILTDDPEFPQAAEAREIYNGYLREYYGFDGCPQFGELVTREQYIQIFGEEPLDLSYIPGAVVKDTEVKGSAKARYNDDMNNYDVSYIPGYEYYTEEVEETTRSR